MALVSTNAPTTTKSKCDIIECITNVTMLRFQGDHHRKCFCKSCLHWKLKLAGACECDSCPKERANGEKSLAGILHNPKPEKGKVGPACPCSYCDAVYRMTHHDGCRCCDCNSKGRFGKDAENFSDVEKAALEIALTRLLSEKARMKAELDEAALQEKELKPKLDKAMAEEASLKAELEKLGTTPAEGASGKAAVDQGARSKAAAEKAPLKAEPDKLGTTAAEGASDKAAADQGAKGKAAEKAAKKASPKKAAKQKNKKK